MESLYETISRLCTEKGITVYKMCKDIGIRGSVISDLKTGRKKSLNSETAAKIANYLGVSIDYLLGIAQKETPAHAQVDERNVSFDDFTYALHNESKELTDENKQKLLEMARLFKLSQDQEKNHSNK
jgi:transcriptional regulator with XRE-family HTH domain